jgi:hypothetical protein
MAEFTYLSVEFSTIGLGKGNESKWFGFRKLEFDDSHDYDRVQSVITSMTNNGWDIFSVTIHTERTRDGVDVDIKDSKVLGAVFEALVTDPENAGTIIAFGELFGWNDAEPFTQTRWGQGYMEAFYGTHSDMADFIQEWARDTDIIPDGFPDWIAIDWTQTFENVKSDFQTFDFEYETYVFLNH